MEYKCVRKATFILLCSIFALALSCHMRGIAPVESATYLEDGTYRGVFIDQDAIQVNVQFTLGDGVVTDAEFRHLRRDDNYHLKAENEPYKSVIRQYQEALDHLVGKDISAALANLYHPEEIVSTEIDGYTSATIRSSKIISAVRDGLNRGVYSY